MHYYYRACQSNLEMKISQTIRPLERRFRTATRQWNKTSEPTSGMISNPYFEILTAKLHWSPYSGDVWGSYKLHAIMKWTMDYPVSRVYKVYAANASRGGS